MFNNYAAILSSWTDTTNFDNIRGAAPGHDGLVVAGGESKLCCEIRSIKVLMLLPFFSPLISAESGMTNITAL